MTISKNVNIFIGFIGGFLNFYREIIGRLSKTREIASSQNISMRFTEVISGDLKLWDS